MERTFHTNHLGHFVLAAVLYQSHKVASNCHIINLSDGNCYAYGTRTRPASAMKAGGARNNRSRIEFDYVWNPDPAWTYAPGRSYGQSKLANLYFARELHKRVARLQQHQQHGDSLQWTVTSVHPGVVAATNLDRHRFASFPLLQRSSRLLAQTLAAWGLFGVRTVEHGAATVVWLASQPISNSTATSLAGKYFVDCQEQSLARAALDDATGVMLWSESERISGVTFDLTTTATPPPAIPSGEATATNNPTILKEKSEEVGTKSRTRSSNERKRTYSQRGRCNKNRGVMNTE